MKNISVKLIPYCFLLCPLFTFAQKQNVYFLKNNGKPVSTKDSADFIRVVSEPDSGSTLYNLKEFYANGAKKLIGKTSRIEPPQLEGQCITFYPSGKRKQLATYVKNTMLGNVYDYYPNGVLYTQKQYLKNQKTNDVDVMIFTSNDSTGKAMVVDGNGHYIGYDDKFEYVEEEGNVKGGLQDGDWKGMEIYKGNKTTFTETYQNGKLISGQSVKDGDVVSYTKRQSQPEFKGGEEGFGRFLSQHIHYPNYEKENNISGRVMIKFVVEKNGKLTEMEVYKSASPGLVAEAMRVLKLSPNWIPGYRFGRPVRVQFTVPINFSLGR